MIKQSDCWLATLLVWMVVMFSMSMAVYRSDWELIIVTTMMWCLVIAVITAYFYGNELKLEEEERNGK